MIEAEQQYKIISDGTPQGTKILDPDGKELRFVKSITWNICVEGNSTAFVTLDKVALEAKNDEETTTMYRV